MSFVLLYLYLVAFLLDFAQYLPLRIRQLLRIHRLRYFLAKRILFLELLEFVPIFLKHRFIIFLEFLGNFDDVIVFRVKSEAVPNCFLKVILELLKI